MYPSATPLPCFTDTSPPVHMPPVCGITPLTSHWKIFTCMAMSILTSEKSTQEIKESEWGTRGGRVKLTTIRCIQYTIDYDCNLCNIFTIFLHKKTKEREREREKRVRLVYAPLVQSWCSKWQLCRYDQLKSLKLSSRDGRSRGT